MSIPITPGSGAASVAAEAVSGLQYQQIELYGRGGGSIASIDPAGGVYVSIAAGATVNIEPSNTSTIGYVQNSVATVIIGGSITTAAAAVSGSSVVQQGTWQVSVLAGQRNDAMSSIESSDGDAVPLATGPLGEVIALDSPITAWVQGTADFRGNSGASIAVIAAQGSSVFTYVREIQVANLGGASVLVTFDGATSSTIGYTIAPDGGGSNYNTRIKTNANGAFTASISGSSSVLVSAQGFTAKE